MLKRFTLKPLVTALLIAVAAGGPAVAAPVISEKVAVAPGRQITPQDEVAISSAAVKVLRHIADARGDLRGARPDTEEAQAQLEQSEKLLEIIAAALPTTMVEDRIWVAKKHLEYEDTQEVLPDLVPIYASLDELVDYVPTAKAKAHLDQAKRALEKGDKPKATEQLQAAGDALMYVEADLPLGTTRRLVTEAKADLAKGDVKSAEQALVGAEDNVVFISISFDAPLTHAKAALWRAEQDYGLGEQDFAKADLNEAVKYLEDAAQTADKVTRKAVAKLVAEVRDVNQAIQSGQEGITTRLQSAWRRVEALSQRSAEYTSTGWQRLRADGAGKKDLIEAKLQLAYARIDHLYASDDAAAKVELAEAKAYLDAASGAVVQPGRKHAVDDVSALVAGLDQALKDGDGAHSDAAAFHRAEHRLATLIRQS